MKMGAPEPVTWSGAPTVLQQASALELPRDRLPGEGDLDDSTGLLLAEYKPLGLAGIHLE